MVTDKPFAAPVSYAQERLWFLDRLEPNSPLYNIPIALNLAGHLEEGAVAAALADLAARHETLRTTFGLVDGMPMQIVAPVARIPLARFDVSDQPESERYAAAFRRAEQDARTPFDLERGPLVRATLVRRSDDAHTLLLTLHHIISDLWSLSVLFRDLAAFLNARRYGSAVQLPELPIQYSDFSEWQRRRLSGEFFAELTSYWKQQLEGSSEVTFPPDHPRPSPQSFLGRTVLFGIPREVRDALKLVCREEGATLFMGLLACFKLVLGRYGGTTDVQVGTPIANRTRSEIENLIGFFVNTLVLRTRLDGDPTFRELLQRVQAVTLGAYDHQELAFEKLVTELGVERRLDSSPVFQVLFGLHTIQQGGGVLDESKTEWGEISTGTAKFDLTVLLKEVQAGLEGGFEYATDLYELETIEQIIENFRSCVRVASRHPDWRLGEIARASMSSEMAAIGGGSLGEVHLEREETCVDLFDRVASGSPDAVALVSPDGPPIVFSELADLSARFATSLRRAGIGPGATVGVAMPSAPESAVAVLGILKAGAAYVPLDPAYPPERLAYMARDANLDLVVASPQSVVDFGLGEQHVVQVDLQRLRSDVPPPAQFNAPTAGDLAYVIYTSGSTGRPKGVAMPHGPLANLVTWQLRQRRAAARTLHLAPLSFDVSFQELFATWCGGGTVILCGEDLRRDPRAVLEWARAQDAQRIFLPPALLQLLAETTSDVPWPESLDEIITAGEALRITPAVRALMKGLPGGVLRNQYGPSETHVVTDHSILMGETDASALPELPPIGRPIHNARAYVLDTMGFPVPRGARGELYLGGPVLARGYFERPGLTAECFLPDPFSEVPGARMYKTGDLVRLRLDGLLEFFGRADEQLKVRGYRVEPAEIQAALERLAGVEAAAVVGVPDAAHSSPRLIAFVVGDEGAMDEESKQRGALRTELPPWMVPERIAVVAELPLTPSGKVDRRKLARREFPTRIDSGESTGPRTELETAIGEIWSMVLPVHSIDVRESFFDLGGHSIAAAQVAARIWERMGVDVPLRTFFDSTSIEEQAKAVVTAKAEELSDEELVAALAEVETQSLLPAPTA